MINSKPAGKRILIVEDEPDIALICTRTLVKDGFEVQIASDGRIARDIIHAVTHDLYILDIRTPLVNGIELYEYLVGKNPRTVRKIIFTTGDVLNGDIGSFVKHTGHPFLAKPFTPDQLRDVVKQTLNS